MRARALRLRGWPTVEIAGVPPRAASPRLRSHLFFSFAGVSLGARRTQPTCRSGRSGKAAVFYHHFSLILPRGNFDYPSGSVSDSRALTYVMGKARWMLMLLSRTVRSHSNYPLTGSDINVR
jgi:hypothetical protein